MKHATGRLARSSTALREPFVTWAMRAVWFGGQIFGLATAFAQLQAMKIPSADLGIFVGRLLSDALRALQGRET